MSGRRPVRKSSRKSAGSKGGGSRARPPRRGGGRPQDHFGDRAKSEGYPARAVYKLQEIDKRVGLLRRGSRVLDLGAAPGSWSLYASQQVGLEGRVVGIDLQEITLPPPQNTRFLQLDLREASLESIGEAARFDVVLSDMAPSTSGMRHRDQFLSYELYLRALELSDALLAEGGHFVGKIFQGAEFADARKATADRFDKLRVIKPEASRSESYEVFLVGLGRTPGALTGA